MKVKKLSRYLLFYITIVFLASCEPVTKIEYVETKEEVSIMSEEEIVVEQVEAIKEYENYITLDNKVMGVVDRGFEDIPDIKGLFKIEDSIYFTIDGVTDGDIIPDTNPVEYAQIQITRRYSQTDGVITEIEESSFPPMPVSDSIEFDESPFRIETNKYNGEDTSRVYNGSNVEAYKQIDGACMRGNDLLYSVPVSYSIRLKGLYIWTADSNSTSRLVGFESGRIW